MIPALRLVVACGALSASPSAEAAAAAVDQPWPQIEERAFSAKVVEFLRPLPAFQYRASQPTDDANIALLQAEVEQCVSAGPIEPCIGMILGGKSHLGPLDDVGNRKTPDYVEKAILAAEKMFPVDLLVVPGDRRLAGSHKVVMDGLRRLDRVAQASGDLYGELDLRTVRRRIAYDTAIWRAGSLPIWTPTSAEVASALGNEGELRGRVKVLGAQISTGPQKLEYLTEAMQLLGKEAAPLMAMHHSEIGNYREAERFAFDGYAAVLGARGAGHPATVAAAAILAKAYSDLGKNDLALPLAREVAAARLADPYINEIQRLDAMMMLAGLVDSAERRSVATKALSIAEGAKAKPQWPVAAQLIRDDSEPMPWEKDGSMGAKNARALDESGAQSLMNVISRAHTLLGMDLFPTDLERAKDHFRKAIKADNTYRLPSMLLAGAIIATSKTLEELVLGPERVPTLLWELDQHMGVPVDHPERILNNMVLAQYYRRAAAEHAPEFARKATDGASKRVRAINVQDESSASEASQLRTVFATQVQSNWDAFRALD